MTYSYCFWARFRAIDSKYLSSTQEDTLSKAGGCLYSYDTSSINGWDQSISTGSARTHSRLSYCCYDLFFQLKINILMESRNVYLHGFIYEGGCPESKF